MFEDQSAKEVVSTATHSHHSNEEQSRRGIDTANEPKSSLSSQKSAGDLREGASGDWGKALESLDVEIDANWPQQGPLPLSEVSRLTSPTDVEGRFRHFQQEQEKFWQLYAQRAEDRGHSLEENLHFFGNWSSETDNSPPLRWPTSAVSTEGFYFRWNGIGIAVNPSSQFLRQFHEKNLAVQDIHLVFSTRSEKSLQDAVEEIYELNAQFNRVSANSHKIDYYLCSATHKELFHRLEPRYRHERHAVFALDRYLDSDEIESLAPLEGLKVSYFYTASDQEAGLLFELELPGELYRGNEGDSSALSEQQGALSEQRAVKLGYVPRNLWQESPPKPLANCHLLIISLFSPQTTPYQERSSPQLMALADFLSAARPKNTLLSEFQSADGDLRLEVVKHVKSQISERLGGECGPILPADGRLQLEMATWRVQCAVTQNWIPAPYVHVIRREAAFGQLVYISSDCVL